MRHRLTVILAMLVGMLLIAQPAHARWHKAESDRFVIYADDDIEDIREFSENLERYHAAMEQFTGRQAPKPSPSNRITVYALGSDAAVRRLAGSPGVVGFYLPKADGSVAFVQNIRNKDGVPDVSTEVLLHEYAHHFMSSTERFAMPLWMNEGAAEYFSKVYFDDDGALFLGTANFRRGIGVFFVDDNVMPVSELLDLDWERLKDRNATYKNEFYARSWLLYHFLQKSEERQGQLREYWLEVLRGKPSLEAARDVFGSLASLDRQLKRYVRNIDRRALRLGPDEVPVSPVSVRELRDGEAAIIDLQVRIDRGLTASDSLELLDEARQIAAEFPDDPAVQTAVARLEYGAGNNEQAVAAADRALALEEEYADAFAVKGKALFRIARALGNSSAKAVAYERAMGPMTALNALEPDHTIPLLYTYRAYAEQSLVPTEDAKAALSRAAELAPFDEELWLVTGMMHMNDGRIADAVSALQPLASNPHGGTKAEQVKGLLAFLAGKQEGEAIPVQAAISAYFAEE